MNYGELKTQIDSGLNRGSTLTDAVDTALRGAILWVESEQPKMPYLYKTDSQVLAPPVVDLVLPDRMKAMDFARIVENDEYYYLTKIEPMEQAKALTQLPTGFWYESGTTMVLAQIPDEAYTLEWGYFQGTDLDDTVLVAASEHWLFDHARTLLEFTTFRNMAFHVRM